jgi:hypothetical protein
VRTKNATSDPLAALRQRLGPVTHHVLTAPTLVEAHRALGALLSGPALHAITARLRETAPDLLRAQLRGARESLRHLSQAAARPSVCAPLRRGIVEYLDCLDAWAQGVGLTPGLAPEGSDPGSAQALALWAQDDNSGCQTGMLRQEDGAVLLWHTEEDTIGYFDRPRVVSFVAGGETLFAFMYPYLLPGPAFGWRAGQIHAVDSLHIGKHGLAGPTPGAPSSAASWLVWRLGAQVPVQQVLLALVPLVDGCALNVVYADPAQGAEVHGEVHEFGASARLFRRLGTRGGARCFQVNVVSRRESRLYRAETIVSSVRAAYDRRAIRTREALARAGRAGRVPTAQDLLLLLAQRIGGHYAYANKDVMAHCIARLSPASPAASPASLELHIESGAALPGDSYAPGWRLP